MSAAVIPAFASAACSAGGDIGAGVRKAVLEEAAAAQLTGAAPKERGSFGLGGGGSSSTATRVERKSTVAMDSTDADGDADMPAARGSGSDASSSSGGTTTMTAVAVALQQPAKRRLESRAISDEWPYDALTTLLDELAAIGKRTLDPGLKEGPAQLICDTLNEAKLRSEPYEVKPLRAKLARLRAQYDSYEQLASDLGHVPPSSGKRQRTQPPGTGGGLIGAIGDSSVGTAGETALVTAAVSLEKQRVAVLQQQLVEERQEKAGANRRASKMFMQMEKMNSETLSAEEVKQQLSSYLQRASTKLKTSLRLDPDLIIEDAIEQGMRYNPRALMRYLWRQLSPEDRMHLFAVFTGESKTPWPERAEHFAAAAAACDAADFTALLDKLAVGIESKRFPLDNSFAHLLADNVDFALLERKQAMRWREATVDLATEIKHHTGNRAVQILGDNMAFPSVRTLNRRWRGDRVHPAGLQTKEIGDVSRLCAESKRGVALMFDEKTTNPGIQEVGESEFGESDWGGLRTDGRRDLHERRDHAVAIRAQVQPLLDDLQTLESAAAAVEPKPFVTHLLAVADVLDELRADLESARDAALHKQAAKKKRNEAGLGQKAEKAKADAEMEGKTAGIIGARTSENWFDRQWDRELKTANHGLGHLNEWQPRLRSMASALRSAADARAVRTQLAVQAARFANQHETAASQRRRAEIDAEIAAEAELAAALDADLAGDGDVNLTKCHHRHQQPPAQPRPKPKSEEEQFILEARSALSAVLDNWEQSQREIAHKVLLFIVEDLQRGADGKGPRGVPVAAVYLGPSCTNDAIERLRDEIIEHLHEQKIEVKLAVSDKQFLNVVEQSTSDGSLPKTATQASRNAKRLLNRVPLSSLEEIASAREAADEARAAVDDAGDAKEAAACSQRATDTAAHARELAAEAVAELLARDAKRLAARQHAVADADVDDDDDDDDEHGEEDGDVELDADEGDAGLCADERFEALAAADAATRRAERDERRAAVEGKAAKLDEDDDSDAPAPQEDKRPPPPVKKPPKKKKAKAKGKASPAAAAARARVNTLREQVGRLIYEAYLNELKRKNRDFRTSFYVPDVSEATLRALLEALCANHNVKTVRQAICNGWKQDANPEQRRLYLAYLRIAVAKDPDIAKLVPKGVLQGKWPQDVDIARQLFSQAVSKQLRTNSDIEAANLADMMRAYYEAADVGGLSAATRRSSMKAVLAFFGFVGASPHAAFWPPARYIKGIAIQTVAGLCISATAYLLLAAETRDGFHPRVFTTDMVESFFSRFPKATVYEFSSQMAKLSASWHKELQGDRVFKRTSKDRAPIFASVSGGKVPVPLAQFMPAADDQERLDDDRARRLLPLQLTNETEGPDKNYKDLRDFAGYKVDTTSGIALTVASAFAPGIDHDAELRRLLDAEACTQPARVKDKDAHDGFQGSDSDEKHTAAVAAMQVGLSLTSTHSAKAGRRITPSYKQGLFQATLATAPPELFRRPSSPKPARASASSGAGAGSGSERGSGAGSGASSQARESRAAAEADADADADDAQPPQQEQEQSSGRSQRRKPKPSSKKVEATASAAPEAAAKPDRKRKRGSR